MLRSKLYRLGRLCKRKVFCAMLFLLSVSLFFYATTEEYDPFMQDGIMAISQGASLLSPIDEEEVLRYIPQNVRKTWQERDFSFVAGIPSVDDPPHRRRRDLLRASWLRYAGVARKENDFVGEMLVLFVLGRHFSHDYVYSQETKDEATESHDVLTLPTNDGRPSTGKKIGDDKDWGFAAMVGSNRKVMMWYCTALQLFPNARFIAKMDDDAFIYIPQLLADLHSLPPRGLYWGLMMQQKIKKTRFKTYYHIGGMCITMSRDVVEHFTSFMPLRRLLSNPSASTRQERIRLSTFDVDSEDVMVGRVLYETRHPNVIFVQEKLCRFHDVYAGENTGPVSSRSVVVHHLKENEYAVLARRFPNVTADVLKPIAFDIRQGPLNGVGQALYSYSC